LRRGLQRCRLLLRCGGSLGGSPLLSVVVVVVAIVVVVVVFFRVVSPSATEDVDRFFV
jgi:hypothetical protein